MTAECRICPRRCRLPEGRAGLCRARICRSGKIAPLAWGRPCALAADPMEKKPLFHFYPGERILSLGMAGCNLRCANCQNAAISQASPADTPYRPLEPADLPRIMAAGGFRHAAYTYTEPLVAFEYVLACARAVREAGGTNVLVSAAYVEPEPLAELLPYLDAANIDLKSMSDAFYRENCGASLAPVLAALRRIGKSGIVLEVTNLLIPGMNDGDGDIAALAHFVRDELGEETPLHFSRFFPCHRLAGLPPTPEDTVARAAEIAEKAGLRHVYRGNSVSDDPVVCAGCGRELIIRRGYRLAANHVREGTCPDCGKKLYGRFA